MSEPIEEYSRKVLMNNMKRPFVSALECLRSGMTKYGCKVQAGEDVELNQRSYEQCAALMNIAIEVEKATGWRDAKGEYYHKEGDVNWIIQKLPFSPGASSFDDEKLFAET